MVAQLFLPGEEMPRGRSRAGAVVTRVLALPEDEVERLTAALMQEFGPRHEGYAATLAQHAAAVASHIPTGVVPSPARTLLLGASVTSEYAVEGAALCNPSAVLHPDQAGLQPGQARVAVSLRGIGEGHLSSLGFASAVLGPGPAWSWEARRLPVLTGAVTAGTWQREQLRAVLADHGPIGGLAHTVLAGLPARFAAPDLQDALATLPPDLTERQGGAETIMLLRRLVASAYAVGFPAGSELSRQVLLPAAEEESHGIEDARITRFTAADGTVDYRATYTAYDGQHVAPRLLTSPDLRSFHAHRLAGPAARNKGMALFPRLLDGEHRALCRSDGESTSVTSSADGFRWGDPQVIAVPAASWEVLQIGNCGPPVETADGWLVLTHGVGPMRTYAIGAMLLDLADPTRVLARLPVPLLAPDPDEQEGYVPHVVYSCGGLLHEGRLWLPYGIGDARIGVAWVTLDELLGAMVPTPSARPARTSA